MESLLNDEYGAVKAKHSSEEALQRWRYLWGVMKNRNRRFRFIANRYEAAALRRTNQLRVAILVSESALQFMQGMRPTDYTVPQEVEASGFQICAEELAVENVSREVKSDYTGPEEVEATGFHICAEELVVENVSREVKSDYTGPEEVETTDSQICVEELVLLPRKSKVLEVVEDVSPEVKSVYTCFGQKSDYIVPEEVEASGFQICSKLLVSSRKKCKFLEEVKKVSLEVKFCCCAFFEDLGCCCQVPRNKVTRKNK